jgi:hypothetical protein
LALFWSFSSGIGIRFAQSSSQWEAQADIPEEMSQTLLQIKSKVSRTEYTPTQTRINREKYTFYVIKSLEHLQKLKTGRVPYLGLELTTMHTCNQKANPSH